MLNWMKNKAVDKSKDSATDPKTFNALHQDQQVERLVKIGRAALGAWGINDADITLIKYRENAVFKVEPAKGGRFRNARPPRQLSFRRRTRFGTRTDGRSASGRDCDA